MFVINKVHLLMLLFIFCFMQSAHASNQSTNAAKEKVKHNGLIALKTAEYLEKKSLVLCSTKIKMYDSPIVIIGVPGMGYQSYKALRSYSTYIQYRFNIKAHPRAHVIIAGTPGLNGTISEENHKNNKDFLYYVKRTKVSEGKIEKNFDSYKIECYPNSLIPDLGQKNCQTCFEETILKKIKSFGDEKLNIIFHGTSQGTATILNYIAKLVDTGLYESNKNLFSLEGKKIKIKAIILEAAFATGKNTIVHNAKRICTTLQCFPYLFWPANLLSQHLDLYSETIVNIARKINVLDYDSKGAQPIDSIEKIPQKIPIILAHSKKDPQIPFSEAEQLFNAGHAKTKLIVLNGARHTSLFSNQQYALLDNFEGKLYQLGPKLYDALYYIPQVYNTLNPGKKPVFFIPEKYLYKAK